MTFTRQPQGIPVGGQFAATNHAEADIALQQATFTEYEAPIVGTAKLSLGSFDVLPEWPAGMPAPSVTYDFDDGKVNTYIDIDDSGSVRSMRFWTDDIDGTNNSTDHGENPWEEFDDEDQEAAVAWGKEVHERIDSSTYGVMIEATIQGKVREIILAHATGASPAPARELDAAASLKQLEDRVGRRYMEAQRLLSEHDRLSMSVLGARILQDFPTATEVRVRQDFDGGGTCTDTGCPPSATPTGRTSQRATLTGIGVQHLKRIHGSGRPSATFVPTSLKASTPRWVSTSSTSTRRRTRSSCR